MKHVSSLRSLLVSIVVALASGCDYPVWLSDELDAGSGVDAQAPVDAGAFDAGTLDAPAADAPDAGPGGPRACEVAPVPLAAARPSAPIEQPSFAVSGRGASLRYGVLLPPSASVIATDDTSLLVADREGAPMRERALRIRDAADAPASTATLHALAPDATAEGFLVLGPRAIWLLDGDGEGEPVALSASPRPEWQRSAGWVDADRFVFVTDTADLRLAVFDRATRSVSATAISAAEAGSVLVGPDGVTISRQGATTDVVVYASALDGAESLHTGWDDGAPLGGRLLAAATRGGERIWIVRDSNEFRTSVVGYRVPADGEPIGGDSITLVSPITASVEGGVVAIQGSGPTLTLFSLESLLFSMPRTLAGRALVQTERDREQLSVLTLRPDGADRVSLELACGVR